jgi:hypothetical protein
MLICQEMSQYSPTVVDVMARADDHTYQGTVLARTDDNSATASVGGNAILALSPMKHLLINNLDFFSRRLTQIGSQLSEFLCGMNAPCDEPQLCCD